DITHGLSFFIQHGFLGEPAMAMQVRWPVRHENPFCVVPGTATNAVSGIHRRLAFKTSAQIRTPRPVAGPSGLSQVLAIAIGSSQATHMAAILWTLAGNEKAHPVLGG